MGTGNINVDNIVKALDTKKATDIKVLNVSNLTTLTDYFIIATGSATPHIRALTENLRKKIKDIFKRLPMGEESERLSKWNLLDYGEVVVHIMSQEQRDIYKIEKFWSHALTLEREVWEEQSKEFAQYE